jgi:hypothetical protein
MEDKSGRLESVKEKLENCTEKRMSKKRNAAQQGVVCLRPLVNRIKIAQVIEPWELGVDMVITAI